MCELASTKTRTAASRESVSDILHSPGITKQLNEGAAPVNLSVINEASESNDVKNSDSTADVAVPDSVAADKDFVDGIVSYVDSSNV